MNRGIRKASYAFAGLAFLVGTGQSFAIEPGDFQPTKDGITIGIPLAASPPPGLYADYMTYVGQGAGTGQNSAAGGANFGNGLTAFGVIAIPTLVWSTGYNILGANLTLAVSQPFFAVNGFQTNCTNIVINCVGSPPLSLGPPGAGGGAFYENVHNTVGISSLSWNFHNGWFTSVGFNMQGPDGSQYNGTLNADYWTFTPTLAVAYLSKDWHLQANFAYDIHTASAGHTGSYAALAYSAIVANPAFAMPGIGYTSGNQLYIDWSAKYLVGKWQFGPVGYFKFQTTADSPGSGWTCALLNSVNVGLPGGNHSYGANGLGCGNATDIGLGGLAGIDFGPAELEVYATDSVYSQDDFKGWGVYTRLSFKLWGPQAPPAPTKGLITKAQ